MKENDRQLALLEIKINYSKTNIMSLIVARQNGHFESDFTRFREQGAHRHL